MCWVFRIVAQILRQPSTDFRSFSMHSLVWMMLVFIKLIANANLVFCHSFCGSLPARCKILYKPYSFPAMYVLKSLILLPWISISDLMFLTKSALVFCDKALCPSIWLVVSADSNSFTDYCTKSSSCWSLASNSIFVGEGSCPERLTPPIRSDLSALIFFKSTDKL